MTTTNRILVAGWKQELDEIHAIASSLKNVCAIVFDSNGQVFVPTENDDNIEFLSIEQSQYTHRQLVLKAPSELALWLFKRPLFDSIYCSRHAGLGFFIHSLRKTVEHCHHWDIQWFGHKSVQKEYVDKKRFIDQEGLLLSYIEEHQEKELFQYCMAREHIAISDLAIIIPFHNRIDYLPFTLSSLNQQGDDLDVVIVNDASSETEREKLEALVSETRFSNINIKIVDSDIPLGASNARNKGVASTNREFVFFLDDDDILAPNALQLCCNAMVRERADVVTVAFSFFDGDGVPDYENGKGMLIQFHDAMDWSSALLYNCVGGISALYRKSVFEEVNGFQCSEFAGEEDWQLILKLSMSGKKVTNIPIPLLWYRNTPFSLSKKMLRYESRQQLCELYKQVLPKSMANLPEFVTSTQHMQKSTFDDIAMLGWKLYPHRNKPLYVYGAGELGRAVLHYLCKLKPSVRIEKVIDRNAAFINKAMEFEVVKLEDCQFEPEAVVIIASLRFVDEIVSALPSTIANVLRLDK
ncbi:glycosyltransferase family 2 protein [Alteromonas gracilis]|uniref:glycosyltransferase family 2 protein n=1 Tax=Alteromonas gracilis TaxID=1479524 RepID=UPI00321A1F55